jgi:hypothetical protein
MIERIDIEGISYIKNISMFWDNHTSMIATSVARVLEKGEDGSAVNISARHELGYYLSLCNRRGFAETEKDLDMCARRYLAGKRKVTPPFTKTRKRAAIKARKARELVPKEVLDQIDLVMRLPIAQNINEKSINALVGMVLKKTQIQPADCKRANSEQGNNMNVSMTKFLKDQEAGVQIARDVADTPSEYSIRGDAINAAPTIHRDNSEVSSMTDVIKSSKPAEKYLKGSSK